MTTQPMTSFKMAREKVSDYLVRIISTPSPGRLEKDIMAVLPIIMMKVACFKGLENDTVATILRKARHVEFSEDDVIVKQGDLGEAFFIILRGSVSIYVDPKQSGEEKVASDQQSTHAPTPDVAPPSGNLGHRIMSSLRGSASSRVGEAIDLDISAIDSSRTEHIPSSAHQSQAKGQGHHGRIRKDHVDPRSRKKYGTLVNSLSRYQAFGELALLYPSKKRNASVIADEKTDLLAVSRETFVSTLKDILESEQEEKRVFIQTHPFFGNWTLPMQRQLQWCLTKSTYKLGAYVIKQGEHVRGLHFLVTGRARLAAEPRRHRQQFPTVFGSGQNDQRPVLERDDSNLSEIVDEMRCSRAYRHLVSIDPMTYIRRTDGYAAAERVVFDKLLDICIIEEGEIMCDCELLLGLERNIFTVICSTSCTFFTLNLKMFDRLIYKKNPQSLKLMKLLAETKLSRRMASSQGRRIGILSPLLFCILNVRVVDPADKQQQDGAQVVSKAPTLPRSHVVKKFHRSETMLIDWFIQGRTPLLQPITKDAIYYREMIQRRAKHREVERQRGPKDLVQVKSLERRVKEAFISNLKEGIKAKNTMKKLSLQRSELTQVTRWK